MKLRVKTIENLILLLIICQVVVFRYLNVYETMNKVILALIVLVAFLNATMTGISSRIRLTNNVPIILVLILLIINGAVYGTDGSFRSNVLMLFYPLMNMLYIVWYAKRYDEQFFSGFVKLRYAINIYFLINIIVLFIQLQGNYFMVGVVTQENGLYQDLVSGLFGYNMTAAVCYFSAFVVAYNTVIARTMERGFKRKLFILYDVVIALVMAYISTQNDNVAYFAFVPLVLIILMLSTYKLNTINGMQRVLTVGLLVIFVCGMLITLVPDFYDYMYDSVLYKFVGGVEHMYDGASVSHGSMERLALVVYGLNYANGWSLGDGLSSSGVYTPYTYGFVHFGNANIGALICLAGIWFYLALIFVYVSKVVSLIENNTNGATHSRMNTVAVLVLYIMASLFSLPLTNVSIGLCVFFIALTFALNERINDGTLYGTQVQV